MMRAYPMDSLKHAQAALSLGLTENASPDVLARLRAFIAREAARRRCVGYLSVAGREPANRLHWSAAALTAIARDGNPLDKAQANWLLCVLRAKGLQVP